MEADKQDAVILIEQDNPSGWSRRGRAHLDLLEACCAIIGGAGGLTNRLWRTRRASRRLDIHAIVLVSMTA
jgi:hypothetical protein